MTDVVEGLIDTPLARRLLLQVGLPIGVVREAGGKDKLDPRLTAYNHAARNAPWFVLRDLDQADPCAPSLVHRLLAEPAPQMRFRVAVRQSESWLLADAEGVAAFLQVQPELIPPDPDELPNAKIALVNLARRSRSREIRAALVPRDGSTAKVGREYTSMVSEFVRESWRPTVAARRSGSLARCIKALRSLR